MKKISVMLCALITSISDVAAQDRNQIKEAQIYLNALGFESGTPDGVWGPNTARAFNSFLNEHKFEGEHLTDEGLQDILSVAADLDILVPADRSPFGQPLDPEWPVSSWHPDMKYDPDHNFYRGGFSRNGWYSSGTVLPHQFNLVSQPHPVRYGTHSERFEIRSNDYDGMENRTEANRSEIGQRSAPRAPSINQDIWFGWSFYYDDLPVLDASYGWYPMFGQWKANMEGAPVIALRPHRSGSWIGVHLDDMMKNSPYSWRMENGHGFPCSLFDIKESEGDWIDIVINTNFGSVDDGYLNIWINDELRCEYKGQLVSDATLNLGYRTAIHKRGYWSGHLSFPRKWRENHPNDEIPTFDLYYDEWRQGRSREEVDIRLIEARGDPAID